MRTHDCVTVPGIGAFLALTRPARFDVENLVVYPAVREICFNASITHNDGLLASSVARREGIGYQEAVKAIEEEIAEMKHALSSHPIIVGELGTLSSTPEGNLSFAPCSSEMEDLRLGFGPVVMGTRTEESQEEEYEEPEYIVRKKGYWYLPIPKTATKVAASLLLLVAVTLSFLLPYTAEKPLPDMASVMPVCRVDIPTPKSEPERPAVEANVPQQKSHPKAYLIVATFRSEAQARRFIENEGDANLELVPGGSLFRVSAASAETSEELRSTLNSREFQNRFSDAWIWVATKSH